MIDLTVLQEALAQPLDATHFDFLGPKIAGKVRDNYRLNHRRVLVVSDRLSAFDRILGLVPFKGQVLNQLSAFWFAQTAEIVANHLLALPDPNVTVAQECRTLPVEVVVRGYITGVTSTSLWVQYSQGRRQIYGLKFPDGLQKNDPLPAPLITPTTKAADGGHDLQITGPELVAQGLVPADTWTEVCRVALALFQRGQEVAQRSGLILVDTKYEFGLDPAGRLTLIDELHTPDSSRFWLAESYAARRAAGQEPENFDKEFVRLHYAALGYRGEGEPLPMPADLAIAAAQRYIHTYELLTGQLFVPAAYPAAPRIETNLRNWLKMMG